MYHGGRFDRKHGGQGGYGKGSGYIAGPGRTRGKMIRQ